VSEETKDDGRVEPRTVFRELAEFPQIRSTWERYVQQKWSPWAEEDRRFQAVQKVYTDLFSIYQKQQRLGEAYEVVLGLGYLTWRTAQGHEVKRHIITAQTSLTFDAARGIITLRPAGEGAKPSLEQDMLEPQERPDPVEQNAIEKQVIEVGDIIWDGVKVHVALKAWIHAVSPRGQYEEILTPQTEVGSNPKIHLAPAVILRKRTDRSLLRVLQEIIEQLRNGVPVPLGVRRLVKIIDDIPDSTDQGERGTGSDRAPTPVEEIHFPLPANDEQLEIVRKLSTRQGVLVQGPPGTGKSHTISNLVCHLLAGGQRVLVTSHTARALNVLRDKFPREIADLCVILLGDDLAAMQALEDSVQGITDRYNTWDAGRNRHHIAELERGLDEARRADASALNSLRALREAETYRHPTRFGTYEGTSQLIGKRLRAEEPRYSWLSGQPSEEDESPLSNAEAVELINLLRDINRSKEEELGKATVDLEFLPTPGDFVGLARKETEALARYETASDRRGHPSYPLLALAPQDLRKILVERLSDIRATYEGFARHIQPWIRQAALQIVTGHDRSWRDLLTVTRDHLKAIGGVARQASERKISGLGEHDRNVLKAHARSLLKHLEANGNLGFGPFRPKVVREALYLIKQVRIDGQLCSSVRPLQNLLEWIEVADHLNALRRHWSRYLQPESGSFAVQVGEYRDHSELLGKVLELQKKVSALREIVATIPGLTEPGWHDPADLRALQEAAEAVTLEEELAEARTRFEGLESQLSAVTVNPNAHPVVGEALESVRTRDEQRYARAYQILCNLRKSSDELQRRQTLLRRLRRAAPKLASQVIADSMNPVWDERMPEFVAAWNWARADRWLRHLNDPQEQERLSHHLESCRGRIRELIRDSAATKAWAHCFSRLTEHERQHLMAWTKAMRRLGKGTGKYASMHRRAAREHMDQCRSAIPAWVMPVYRVAESVRPGVDTFDVVIVDEASQSGPEALFLLYLARKIVVVGDDKQISPDFVGITREDVELLRQRHIRDLPHSDALGVDNSFFDQAEIRYGGRIRLREHFRCMPEIIQFSNNLCYRSEPLIPLRQYGAGRLTPVIVTRHVTDGYQQGHSPRVVNRPEAEAIVDQIKGCCEDLAYDGKTMGVISLLGEDQARLIEKLLLDRIGPEEMERRHLVCGDAYAFQGDERDVMFLSLVSAPAEGRRIGTLASPRDERRFNVAASRAKDQMWLFHTATLNDLSPNCLRYRLLQYCQNPQVLQTDLEGLSIEQLRTTATAADRDGVRPPFPFGSWFEVDVFLAIAERGYRVLPQFDVAGYRIDLVVEGIRGRLAVECDGDTWHGAARYDQDMVRERMLERCGWTFWRIRGSTYYREPEAALEGLWTKLNRLEIHPRGQDIRSDLSSSRVGRSPASNAVAATSVTTTPDVRKTDTAEKEDSTDQRGIEAKDYPVIEKGPETPSMLPLTTTDRRTDEPLVGKPHHVERGPVYRLLKPYSAWTPRPLPDPRLVSIDDLVPGLVDIIAIEGPMLCHRAYRIYVKAAGIQRVGRQIRSLFNRAVRKAVRMGLIEERNENETRDQINQVVRKAGTPAVRLRTRGDRTFHEIPPAEVAELMNCLLKQDATLDTDELFDTVLNHYEVGRMTSNIRTILLRIKSRYVDRAGSS
jgi:very-short-patch-repair endonuclease